MIAANPDIFDKWIEKLASLVQANANDEFDSPIPNETAVNHGRRVVERLRRMKFAPNRVDSSAEGGVNIAFIQDDLYADVECLNSGEILAVTSNRKDRPRVWEVQPNDTDIDHALEILREHVCA